MTEQPAADNLPVVSGEPSDASFETDPLGRWERLGAVVLGLGAGGGGAWAVFTTDNQAGSAVLVIIGAAFTLMGLQGTPLIRVGSAESGVELERRRRRVDRAIEQARQEESPEVAVGIVEGASIIEPNLFRSARYRNELYTSKVALALQTAGAMVARSNPDYGHDLVATTESGVANVEVRYREHGPLRMQDVRQARVYSYSGARALLVVTNAPLLPEVMEFNSSVEITAVEAVSWNDERDTPLLARALMRVIAARQGRDARENQRGGE
ncbi:hypothetical protein [Micromonospora humida]|uniref:hypothetical protein n=1 Tax=Micromonospora humida TaxID=2809018 RepID=UPI003424CBFB